MMENRLPFDAAGIEVVADNQNSDRDPDSPSGQHHQPRRHDSYDGDG